MSINSDMAYWPAGRMSASTGTPWPTREKSSSSSGTSAALAMASRCSTKLVEPPRAMATVMAFSKDSRLKMSLGLMPRSMSRWTAAPAL